MTLRSSGDMLKGLIESRPDTCPQHGEYQALLIPMGGEPRWTGCPQCAQNEVDRREEADEQEKRRRMGMAWRGIEYSAGIPRKHLNSTIRAYRACHGPKHFEALGQVRSYAERLTANVADGLGLILMGTVGTGKTHLGVAVLRNAIRRHHLDARYTTADRLFMRVRETYKRDAETESEVMRDMVTPDLLMIDEIGMGNGSQHELIVLSTVLGRRYDECKATILATNLEPALLRECLGDRVTDRMREVNEVVEFQWPSYRAGGDA